MYDVLDNWVQNLGTSLAPWNVTASLIHNTGDASARLEGNTTVPFINGTANFTDLQITHAGTGYQLKYEISYPNDVLFSVTGDQRIDIKERELGFRFNATISDPAEANPMAPHPIVFVFDRATGQNIENIGSKGRKWLVEATLEKPESSNAALIGMSKVEFGMTHALFNNLSVDKSGSGYRLILKAYTEPSSRYASEEHITNEFSVTERSFYLRIARQPADCNETVVCRHQPIVEIRSQSPDTIATHLNWDNLGWHIEASKCSSDPANPLLGTKRLAIPTSGVVEYQDLSFYSTGQNYRLCFKLAVTPTTTKYENIAVQSNAFSINKRLFYLRMKVQPGMY